MFCEQPGPGAWTLRLLAGSQAQWEGPSLFQLWLRLSSSLWP